MGKTTYKASHTYAAYIGAKTKVAKASNQQEQDNVERDNSIAPIIQQQELHGTRQSSILFFVLQFYKCKSTVKQQPNSCQRALGRQHSNAFQVASPIFFKHISVRPCRVYLLVHYIMSACNLVISFKLHNKQNRFHLMKLRFQGNIYHAKLTSIACMG